MITYSSRFKTGIQFPFGPELALARKLGHSRLVSLAQFQVNVNASGVKSGQGGDPQPLTTSASSCKSCGIFGPLPGDNTTSGVQGEGVAVTVSVGVFVKVGEAVSVSVGVVVGMSVGVLLGVFVGVCVAVAVLVGVSVGVLVNVAVAVWIGVDVNLGVLVGLGVFVGLGVLVALGVFVGLGAACTIDGAPPKNETSSRKMIVSRLALNRTVFIGLLGSWV